MTDKEILDVVHQTMLMSRKSPKVNHARLVQELTNFIEQEWQKEDEKNADSLDVKEIERHRGLEIGPDGTVKSLI